MLNRFNDMLDGSNDMLDGSNDMLDRSNDMLDRSNDMLDRSMTCWTGQMTCWTGPIKYLVRGPPHSNLVMHLGEKASHLGDEGPILVYEWTRKRGGTPPKFGLEDFC
ncbi:hypothetical protein TNCV_4078541 [Trichonephila clavipes]|nr:hypothetical protein TNCV_4078541 [Trichonephila clavipes]